MGDADDTTLGASTSPAEKESTPSSRRGREFERLAENRLWPEDAVDPSADQGPVPEAYPTPEDEEQEGGRDARQQQPILYGYAVHDGALILRAGAMLYRIGPVDCDLVEGPRRPGAESRRKPLPP